MTKCDKNKVERYVMPNTDMTVIYITVMSVSVIV